MDQNIFALEIFFQLDLLKVSISTASRSEFRNLKHINDIYKLNFRITKHTQYSFLEHQIKLIEIFNSDKLLPQF